MTFSAKLNRHIDVPPALMNNFDVAELDAASRKFFDATPRDIRQAAENGDIDAQYIVSEAKGNGYIAEICRGFINEDTTQEARR